ncbi:MAG: TetR/AcrR family transcriptional regulator [Burkholderiaceae bacterium]
MSSEDPIEIRPARVTRAQKEQRILDEAEVQFAQFGFEGASLESIAAAAGISRHNLLYYFSGKEVLYRRVLDDVLEQWLVGMGELSSAEDPEAALSAYIASKVRSSMERPSGAKIFAKEIIAGAPRYADVIRDRVQPLLQADVKTFERWARKGLIARLNFTHLMFIIWSATQAYAELGTQFSLLLGKPELEARDFEQAQTLITRLVLAGLRKDAGTA